MLARYRSAWDAAAERTLKKLFAERRLATFEAAFETEARMHRIVLGDAATRKRIEAEFVE